MSKMESGFRYYHMRMLQRGLVPDQFALLLLANTMDVGVKYST